MKTLYMLATRFAAGVALVAALASGRLAAEPAERTLQGAWAEASAPDAPCLVITNCTAWILKEGVWRPSGFIGSCVDKASFRLLGMGNSRTEGPRNTFWRPRKRDYDFVRRQVPDFVAGDFLWAEEAPRGTGAVWSSVRKMVRARMPDWSRVCREQEYVGVWKPVRIVEDGGEGKVRAGPEVEDVGRLRIRADRLTVFVRRGRDRSGKDCSVQDIVPWLPLEGGLRFDYRQDYARYEDPVNCMHRGLWLAPTGELLHYTDDSTMALVRVDEPFDDPVDARRKIAREGAYHGVWGVNSEFNIFILSLDRRGKGLLSGFMSLVPFDWKATGDGTIRCTLDAEMVELAGGKLKGFDCRYDPLKNQMEALLPPDPDEGEDEPRRKTLPFMSGEVRIDEMLAQFETRRKSPEWRMMLQEARNRPPETAAERTERLRLAEEKRAKRRKWEAEQAARAAKEAEERKMFRNVLDHYGRAVRDEAYYSETNALPAKYLQENLWRSDLGSAEDNHVVVAHIQANPRLFALYRDVVSQEELLPADLAWLFRAILDDYLVRHDDKPLRRLFRVHGRDLSVEQYEEALRRISDGDPAKPDIVASARFRDPRLRAMIDADDEKSASAPPPRPPRRPAASDPRLGALRTCAAAKGYDITGIVATAGCWRVDYVLRPTTQSFIRCQLALPVKKPWSGRLWGCGNGGGAGQVRVNVGMAQMGDVVVHTDMGTSRGVHDKPEVVRDFGWRATHLMTVSAKDLAAAFFGHGPKRSYFIGGSTGGGQGFHEALRFPEDYDGVIAYVPANTRIPLHVYFAWNLRLMKDADGRDVFTPAELAAVEQAAVDHFADRDVPAFRGRFLSDTRYDAKTEAAILARAKAKAPSLDTPDKLARLHGMFTGPVLDGKPVHAGVPFSASFRGAAGNQWMLQWFLGPGRPLHTVTDAELARWLREWGPDCDACGDGFARFAARGGKMIVVGGLEDSIVPYPSMIDWYERATAECGGRANLEKSCRLYLLPGRAHGQGRGCGRIVGDSALLVDWVEKGVAPSDVRSPLRGGGELTVKPYPCNWAREKNNGTASADML